MSNQKSVRGIFDIIRIQIRSKHKSLLANMNSKQNSIRNRYRIENSKSKRNNNSQLNINKNASPLLERINSIIEKEKYKYYQSIKSEARNNRKVKP